MCVEKSIKYLPISPTMQQLPLYYYFIEEVSEYEAGEDIKEPVFPERDESKKYIQAELYYHIYAPHQISKIIDMDKLNKIKTSSFYEYIYDILR